MAFRETIGAEPFNLRKAARGEIGVIAAILHASQKPRPKFRDMTLFLERGQGTAQRIGLGRGETGPDNCDLHCLFLKQGHAQGLAQHSAQRIRGKLHRLLPIAAANEGMHHIALNRPRSDDRHLDHQIIERTWAHTRQKIHLRARFHLKHTQTVCFAQHIIDAAILGGQGGQIKIPPIMTPQKIKGFAQTTEHSQGQNIDLQNAQGVNIILIPCDDGAILHRGIFYGHKRIKPPFGNHKAPHMLAEMAGEADNLAHQIHHQAQMRVIRIKTDFAQSGILQFT